ncbi:MAG: hypothetical protein M1834_003809 [Cirrosporium novae-zelandiae]|nr:MAG: hypothetical protein M1834_003809 [Cirrosporium novae-zelandiae]
MHGKVAPTNISALELAYEKYIRYTEVTCEEEKARQLRVRILLLQDENNDLHDQLAQADEQVDGFEESEEQLRGQLEGTEQDLQRTQNELRMKTREAELRAMNGVSADSAKLLTEKLTLARELSNIKPELEHLRTQAASVQSLLSEKLSLQRQLSSMQVELETEKRASERARARMDKNNKNDAKLEEELEEIRKELAKEKRERQKIEKDLETQSTELETTKSASDSAFEKLDKHNELNTKLQRQLENLQKELANEKEEREKAEKEIQKAEKKAQKAEAAAQSHLISLEAEKKYHLESLANAAEQSTSDAQLEEELENIRKELAQEKERNDREALKDTDEELEALRVSIAQERKERQKLEKTFQKQSSDLENKNLVLEDKLNAFRDKLRSTKEVLKTTRVELSETKAIADKATASLAAKERIVAIQEKNPRKRTAAHLDADAAIGTPGFNGRPKKRASAMVGEKSEFSITPFLNKTITAADDSEEDELSPHAKRPEEDVNQGPAEEKKEDEDEEAEDDTSNKNNEEPAELAIESEVQDKEELVKATTQPKLKGRRAPAKPRVKPKEKPSIAKDAVPRKTNPRRRKPTTKQVSSLEKVTEEAEEAEEDGGDNASKENDANEEQATQKSQAKKVTKKSLMLPPLPTVDESTVHQPKKKRKLLGGGLGKTLFDEDEGPDSQKPHPSKPFGSLARSTGVGGHALAAPKGGLRVGLGGFGTISPLKKDRRKAS